MREHLSARSAAALAWPFLPLRLQGEAPACQLLPALHHIVSRLSFGDLCGTARPASMGIWGLWAHRVAFWGLHDLCIR